MSGNRLLLYLVTVVLAAGCSQTTTVGNEGAQEGPFRSDVGTDSVTLGDTTANDAVEIAEICGAISASDDLWIPETGDFVLSDRETGSLWNVRGQAFSGPCAGAQLSQVPGFVTFWFAWSASRNGGEIWNQDTPNASDDIQADPDGECSVPCDEIRSGGPPPDGIPALDHLGRWNRPRAQQMVAPDHPDAAYLGDFDIVNGVYIDGEARAYPHQLLNWHENHVDQIGAVEYNMSYCPLTGSAILIPTDQGGPEPLYFFVSGRLYNDNLTMAERDTSKSLTDSACGPRSDDPECPSFWNQMLLRAIGGPRDGERLTIWPVVETTWSRWQQMHPNTLVSSSDTGYPQSLRDNPYTSRQLADADTLFPVNPGWDNRYSNKSRVLALDGESTHRAYPFDEMESFGDRVVINDTFEGQALVVLYEAEHRTAIPYYSTLNDAALSFDGATAP